MRFSDWISVLMAKDAASRPRSAAEAWETLEELALSVAGPRWRRASALPDLSTGAVPGPYTPPPSTAVPSDPVFETFHASPAAAPSLALTVAPSEPVAPADIESRPRRGLFFALAGGVAVAGVGLVLVTRGDEAPSPAPPARVSHAAVATVTPLDAGKVRVTLPPGWEALSLPVNVPGLPRERAAAPGGTESAGVVLVGMAPRDAHNRRLLSPRVGKGKPVEVKLGALAAYRYTGLHWHGRALTVYAAPTTRGVATVACLSPAPDCARIAGSLAVPGAKAFPLGDDPAFGRAVRRALHVPAGSLRQGTPAGQASAARRIAADLRAARAKLVHVKAGPADQPLRAGLTRRVAAIAAAYGDLAQAAASNDRGAYAKAAEHARAAEDALRRTLRHNRIPASRARSIPALRRPPAPPKPKPTPTPVPTVIPRPRVTPVATPVGPSRTPDPDHCYDCGDWQHATGGG